MISSKLFFSIFCFSVPVLFSGCSTKDFKGTIPSFASDSRSLKALYEAKSSQEFSLLVGLKPYLGRGTAQMKSVNGLHLKSAGQPLILKDSDGVQRISSEISLYWRTVSLLNPQKLERQVVGPFASFESAQRMVEQLSKQGVSAEIAHPKEWEVWIQKGVEVPKQINTRILKKELRTKIRPVLKGARGEILLSAPVKIEAPDGLYLDGGLYSGPFWLKPDAYGSWTFIEEVSIERYLQGVVPHEIGPNAPEEALAAQAVLARTWAIANTQRFAIDGYHLCSDTQCQVYKEPHKASQSVKRAISKTTGKYLGWDKQPIHAVYHASNGGVMASASEAWSMSPVPYLRVKLDGSKKWRKSFTLPLQKNSTLKVLLKNVDGAYGNTHSRFRWVSILSAEDIKNAVDLFESSNALPSRVEVLERGESGRVLSLEIFDADRQLRKVLKLDEIRRVFRNLPSTLFVVHELKKGVWQFSGGGFGHGAGLSQAGAIDLAQKGWKASEILMHYYPGTNYGTLQDLPKAP